MGKLGNCSERGAINRILQREMFIENIKFLIPYTSHSIVYLISIAGSDGVT
jgi:hypothetical protein